MEKVTIKNYLLLGLISSLILLAGSCTQQESRKPEVQSKEEKLSESAPCRLVYNPDATEVKWTAFKTTEKIGVGGTFTDVKVKPGKKEGTVKDILQSLRFEIQTKSLNSGVEDRDNKIKNYFFSHLVPNGVISGEITEVTEEPDGGKVKINLTMNGVTNPVEGNYRLQNENITLFTKLDVNNWNGQEAVKALNEVCFELHKGADGVSKLWSEVDVEVVSVFQKKCD